MRQGYLWRVAVLLPCMVLGALLSLTGLSAGTGGGAYSDPVAYCAAYRDVDQPGSHYTGPKSPAWMLAALDVDRTVFPQDGLNWRCMNGRVLACFDYNGPVCEKADTTRTPTSAMHDWCRSNPNSEIPVAVGGNATIYEWDCRGRLPVVSRQAATLDARGYIVGAFEDITAKAPGSRSASPAPHRDAYLTAVPPDYVRPKPMSARQIAYISETCHWHKDPEDPTPYDVIADFDDDGEMDQATILVNRRDPSLHGLLINTSAHGQFFIPDGSQTDDPVVASEFLMPGRRGGSLHDTIHNVTVYARATFVVAIKCPTARSAHVFDPSRGYFRNLWEDGVG